MAFTSGTKVYHRLINGQVAKKGTINKWSGCYTWFTPLIDNDRLLCYEMTYNGGNYLFIQTKKAVSTVVDLPAAVIEPRRRAPGERDANRGRLSALGTAVPSSKLE